jgi:hypothetical protein
MLPLGSDKRTEAVGGTFETGNTPRPLPVLLLVQSVRREGQRFTRADDDEVTGTPSGYMTDLPLMLSSVAVAR